MLEPAALAVVGAAVFAASVLSGIFGMAGGLILLGALLVYLDVVAAMILFGAIQVSAGGWRAVLWIEHVRWSVLWKYLIGATSMFLAMRYVRFVPDKALIYLGLGLMPFAANLLPRAVSLDIMRPWMPVFAGLLLQNLQLLAGGTGVILDLFFQKSGLDRKAIIGTKAVLQVVGHAFRVLYFGSLAAAFDVGLPWWAFAGAIVLAVAGTSLAGRILEAMSEESFRAWSWWLIYGVSALYVARGLWLLAT
jgi:uncharacterized membrane protein YfcA